MISKNESPELKEEARLKKMKSISPGDVHRLKQFTRSFLCSPDDIAIDFTRFKVRDNCTGSVLFDIKKPKGSADRNNDTGPNKKGKFKSGRYVHYQFPSAFLKIENLTATIEFSVGDCEIQDFRIIERHFFKDKPLETFDLEFGSCLPNSNNTCEHIYRIPKMSHDLIEDMINNPLATKSDSFYFVNGRLVMHQKAYYSYKDNPKPFETPKTLKFCVRTVNTV